MAAPLYHPATGGVVLDTDDTAFSRDCGNTEVLLNQDGGLDLNYNGLNVVGSTDSYSKVCQAKMDITVPAGWKVEVQVESAVTGTYVGPALAIFQHSKSGTSSKAIFKRFSEGADSYTIDYPRQEVTTSSCGRNIGIKTVTTIVARSDESFIDIGSGWKYYLNWTEC